jgi:tetratricopeptide (TPR) repeat protein
LDGSPESALRWIGSLNENYILIFDNADVLSPAVLEGYLPPGRKGNILITSRNSAMRTLTSPENSLEVIEMEEKDAIGLLLKACCLESPTSDVQVEASRIVKKLFCFPLAIDQAGAYIASGATTIGDYLAKYSEHQKMLLCHSEFTGASKYNKTVYETWELSYKEIQQRAESDDSHKANAANSAMFLLELFPFFHHEGITEEIFSYAALQKVQKTSNPELPLASSMLDQRLLPLNKAGTWDNFIFREGIRILLSFSLIRRGPSDNVYAMHPLVHAWGRDRLTLNKRKRCCFIAYVTLSCSLRWDAGQQYGFQRTLVTHVRANMGNFESDDNQHAVSYMDDAYDKFGRLLSEQGYSKEAETLEIEVLNKRNKILGVEHPDTITAMGNLASTYVNLGKYTEAEKLQMQVLGASNRILGVEHPHTINAMANLASTYQNLGKYTEAEKLQMQVLDARNRILGVEHPDTINAMASLASTYRNLGKYTEAEKLEMQVLDARNRILGVEHPDTIIAMASLASTYRNLGKYTEAEKLEMQVLDASNRILGVEHPYTIFAMANLAATYWNLGKYTEAEKLHMQVLDASNRILGVEHPGTIRAMANLATTYQNLGKYTEAEKLDLQVLDARNRILEVEHPDTINAMANLASTYRNLGKYTEAEKLEMQVLDARNRILGVEHPDTIIAMANLAATYWNLGKYTEAEKLQMQVLDASNRILGVEHPDTITAMANLASTYQNLGKYTDTEKLEMQVLDARNRILGVEHPDTINTMANLAVTYQNLGKYREGEKLQIQAQEAQSRVFEEEHSHKIKTIPNVVCAQDTAVLDKRSIVPKEETSDSVQVVSNPAVQAVLPDTIINPEKKGMLFVTVFLKSL